MVKNKKIFITGASGYIGRDLIGKLSKDNQIILLLHNNNTLRKLKSKNIKVITGDLENASVWGPCLEGVDIVIHLAGITHAKNTLLYKKINTYGTSILVDEANAHKIWQFVYISTRAIGKKCGEYGESKKLAEDYIKKSGLKYTIFRVAEAYDESFKTREGLGNLMKIVEKNIIVPYIYAANITLSPIHKEDIIDSITASLANNKSLFKTYTLAGPESLTFKDIESRLAMYKNLKRIFLPVPLYLIKPAFFLTSKILKLSTPDQLQRLTGKKDLLSSNIKMDLKISPRKFLF